jgi:hypothetical protein
MANTIVVTGRTIDITFDGSTTYDIAADTNLAVLPSNGMKIKSLEFIPAATDDVITVRNGAATAAAMFYAKAADAYDQKAIYFNDELRRTPYIVGNQVTANSRLLINF